MKKKTNPNPQDITYCALIRILKTAKQTVSERDADQARLHTHPPSLKKHSTL